MIVVIIDNKIVINTLNHFLFIKTPVNDQYRHIEHIKTKHIRNKSAIYHKYMKTFLLKKGITHFF
jgi:hypothetical protein